MTKKSSSGKITLSTNFLTKYSHYILVAGIFVMTYLPTVLWMWDRWFARDSYYSHGILIPFVTGFLIWQKREELAAIKHKRSPWAMPLIIIGIFIHIASSLFRIYFSSGFSMLIVLFGLVLHFFGSKFLRQVFFPLFFLIFMIPVPLFVITKISITMKMFAAEIATNALNNMGILAIREGSLIKMRQASVIVDDVCSGLRSLISLTALGSIFAYWMKSSMFKRILLFLSTIPIAIVTNVCRIILLASIAEIWGTQYARGFVHDFSGFFVFALAFVLLFGMGRILE